MPKNLLNGYRIFHTGDDMHGRINAAGAWMRRSGDLDWTFALLTDTDVNMACMDAGQGREQER